MRKLIICSGILLYSIAVLSQNVGIGTPTPLNLLHVQGGGTSNLTGAFGTGLIFSTNNGSGPRIFLENLNGAAGQKTMALVNETINGQGTTYFGSLSDNGGAWVNIHILSMNHSTGNVGIGTPTPFAKLEVAGGVKISDSINIGGQMRISSGNPGAGKVLTSDASGLASWTTPSASSVPDALPTIQIGTQKWMSKNLDVAFYRNGDPIPQVTDPTAWAGLTTGAWCYYNNDPTQGTTYGKLYNWYAVNDPRGLAPTGWHIPSDAEWTALSTTLGGDPVSGGPIKEAGTLNWSTPNTGGNNNSGFAGLPGGIRNFLGTFGNVGIQGYWWSSTESNTTAASSRYLFYSNSSLGSNVLNKQGGFSVRCLRD